MRHSPSLWLIPLFALAPTAALAQSANLLGTIGGTRLWLGTYGVTLAINDSENLLGNISGGVKQGATLQGVANATLQINTATALHLPGGTLNISALQIHGRSLSPYYLGTLQSANGNEAENATRLWELWYDQTFPFENGDLKIGQQSIDNEFIGSHYSGLFVNTMAGWPLIPSVDLYGGGPAYPLSAPGARIQLKPTATTTLLAGAFDDNPGGGAFADDAQALDSAGTKFNLHTGALFIAELQLTASLAGQPGTYKLGAWYDSGAFPDQRYGTDGLSLASPASNGNPAQHKGNYSPYAVIDQTIWQSATDSNRNLDLFTRLMGAPDAQNLVDFSFNGGLSYAAPLPGRDSDTVGIDMGIGHVSPRASGLDRDAGTIARGTETLLELTYQAQATPWLQLQPDLQYVLNPGGGLLNPAGTQRLRNEVVAGIRVITTF